MRKSMVLMSGCCMTAIAVNASLAVFEFAGISSGDNQFNTVTVPPENGSFGAFTRVNVLWNTGQNVFNSRAWHADDTPDLTQYVGFYITPNTDFGLDLAYITFESRRSSSGPNNALVSLFLNGSAVAQENYSFSPATSLTPYTFDFSDIARASSAEFRFYGYGAGGSAGTMQFDSVETFGAFAPVPEPSASGVVAALGLLGWAAWKRIFHGKPR